jgi:hypothetical protein
VGFKSLRDKSGQETVSWDNIGEKLAKNIQ